MHDWLPLRSGGLGPLALPGERGRWRRAYDAARSALEVDEADVLDLPANRSGVATPTAGVESESQRMQIVHNEHKVDDPDDSRPATEAVKPRRVGGVPPPHASHSQRPESLGRAVDRDASRRESVLDYPADKVWHEFSAIIAAQDDSFHEWAMAGSIGVVTRLGDRGQLGKSAGAERQAPEDSALLNRLKTIATWADTSAEWVLQALYSQNSQNLMVLESYVQLLVKKREQGKAASILEEALVSTQSEDVSTLLVAGRRYAYSLDNPDRGEELFRRSLEIAPNDPEVMRALAGLLHERGRSAEARAYFKAAIAIAPTSVKLLTSAANFFSDIEELNYATELYDKALSVSSDDRALLISYAHFADTKLNDHDRALNLYERALSAYPTDAFTMLAFANFLSGTPNAGDRVEDLYEQAVITEPENALALSLLAYLLMSRRKDFKRAVRLFERALELDPRNLITLWGLANLTGLQGGDLERGEALYRQALAVDPTSVPTLRQYADFLQRHKKDTAGARARLNEALDLEPDDLQTLHKLASLAVQSGDIDSAESLYERALTVDPENLTSLRSYATFLESRRHDYDKAEDLYHRALGINPKNAYTLRRYGVFLQFYREDLTSARARFQEALDADPSSLESLCRLASVLTQLGDVEGAEALYERALSIGPDHSNVLTSFAEFLANTRVDLDRAEELYRRAIDADPKNLSTLFQYGVFLQVHRNDAAAARARLREALSLEPENLAILLRTAEISTQVGELDDAEDLYRRAVQANPEDPDVLELYAQFLYFNRSDMARAESLYRKVMLSSDADANVRGNLAQLVLSLGRMEEGAALVAEARALDNPPHPALRLELNFYIVAYGLAGSEEAMTELKFLLDAGHTSPGWNLEPTIMWVRNNRPSDLARVARLAESIVAIPRSDE